MYVTGSVSHWTLFSFTLSSLMPERLESHQAKVTVEMLEDILSFHIHQKEWSFPYMVY